MNFQYCEGTIHVVEEGDTLYKISKMHEVPLALIMRANPYVDVYNLKIGTEICVPLVMERPQNNNSRPITMPVTREESGEQSQQSQIRQITMPGLTPDMEESIVSYVVKENDTLQGILEQFEISSEDLLKFNTSNGIQLKPGSILIIPEKSDEE